MESSDNCMDYTNEMDCNMSNGCEWMMGMCMESGGGMQMGNNTPHFIAVDELNGYWFVSTIASGYIARFKLITNDYNKGKGFAIKKGLKKVTNKKVIIFDGDNEIPSSEIEKLMILDEKNGVNFVMGYRFKNINLFKSKFDFGNLIFTMFFNILFNSNYRDVLC